tara:strand:+ start:16 stop:633 length:618 start_codon:yes stop_codon:yes gene_type:complete
MAFKMKGWEPFSDWKGKDSARPDGRAKSSAFQKTSVDKKNKQKMFSKKTSDLRQAWKKIKDPNSNRAKQLKREAKKIGLTLEQTPVANWDSPMKAVGVGAVKEKLSNVGEKLKGSGVGEKLGSKLKSKVASKTLSKVSKSKLLSKGGKRAAIKVGAKLGARAIPGVGAGMMAYDVGKFLHKNRHEPRKQLTAKAKSKNYNLGRKF